MGDGGSGQDPGGSLLFQPTPTCLSVGDTAVQAMSTLSDLFQPTPTCLSVGDTPEVAAEIDREVVSTHAHLSVGGRPKESMTGDFIFGFQPTPTCLSVGDAPHIVYTSRASLFQPTPTCLSVGDTAL